MNNSMTKIENIVLSQISIINLELALFEAEEDQRFFTVSEAKKRSDTRKNYRSSIRKLHIIKKYANYIDTTEILELILGRAFQKIPYGVLKNHLSQRIKPAA